MTTPFQFLSTGDRAAAVAGLRDFADFLESHPDVPAPDEFNTSAMLFTRGYTDTDERACRAEVDRAAAALGVTPQSGEHYTAERRFGPISYRVVHIPEAVERAHHARESYTPVVQVDPDTTGAGVAA